MTMERSPTIPANVVKQPNQLGSNRTTRHADGKDFKEVLKNNPDARPNTAKRTSSEDSASETVEDPRATKVEIAFVDPGHALQMLTFPNWQLAQQSLQGQPQGSDASSKGKRPEQEQEPVELLMSRLEGSTGEVSEALTKPEGKTSKSVRQPQARLGQPDQSRTGIMETETVPLTQAARSPDTAAAMSQTAATVAEAMSGPRHSDRLSRRTPQDRDDSHMIARTGALNEARLKVEVVAADAPDQETPGETSGGQQDADPLFALGQSATARNGPEGTGKGPAEQISDRVGTAATELLRDASKEQLASPVRQLVMRLHPEELGEVRVSLRLDRGRLSISIEAAERTAADLLHRDRDMLESLIGAVAGDGGNQQVTVSVMDARKDLSDRSPPSGSDSSGLQGERQGADAGRPHSRRPEDSSSGKEVGSGMTGDRETIHDEPSLAGRRLPGVIVV